MMRTLKTGEFVGEDRLTFCKQSFIGSDGGAVVIILEMPNGDMAATRFRKADDAVRFADAMRDIALTLGQPAGNA